jgi:hypothetical protein
LQLKKQHGIQLAAVTFVVMRLLPAKAFGLQGCLLNKPWFDPIHIQLPVSDGQEQ